MSKLVVDATGNRLSYQIIGAAMAVHNHLGCGLKEEVYEKALEVEIKAFSHLLTNDELAQVINYLKVVGAPLGLLFNFGRSKLEYRRVFPSKSSTMKIRTSQAKIIK